MLRVVATWFCGRIIEGLAGAFVLVLLFRSETEQITLSYFLQAVRYIYWFEIFSAYGLLMLMVIPTLVFIRANVLSFIVATLICYALS